MYVRCLLIYSLLTIYLLTIMMIIIVKIIIKIIEIIKVIKLKQSIINLVNQYIKQYHPAYPHTNK